ncbi:hypothetical protein KGA66_17735 [Actinocrinis puniceicyclus]|uniref:Penicillin-binding protein transpeptidase domain-containing protein n=1 Tax=Actinocrinis puniceicyclus TaxID=977794 RepID=A0A8J7WRL3_9ACTN|nr:penicillin-binding transpeptidase domain-containing protein [Actinocrinis puniceicyclus]MBS2964904.1 hypothetical protein [Actinocrinis puniceicyclus]
MTDETKPQRAANGPQEREDALDSWFSSPPAAREEGSRAAQEDPPSRSDPESTPPPAQAQPEDETQALTPAAAQSGTSATSGTAQPDTAQPDTAQPETSTQLQSAAPSERQADRDTDHAQGGPDEALTQALNATPGPDNDVTQLVMPKAVSEPSGRDEQPRAAAGSEPAETGDSAEDTADPSTRAVPGGRESIPGADDRTQVIPVASAASPPRPYAAAAPTQAIPRAGANVPRTPQPPQSDMAVRGGTTGRSPDYGADADWHPQAAQEAQPPRNRPRRTPNYEVPAGQAPILPARPYSDYDDFDDYEYGDTPNGRRPGRRRGHHALLVTAGVAVVIVAVIAALALTGRISVPGISAKPVPTVGFSPSGSDAGSDATQTGTAFLTAWQNGNLKAAANITDAPGTALAQLTAYKNDLKVSSLSLMPGTASAAGWMTFSVAAQVGTPAGAWSYNSGMATYSKDVNGYTRWFVKWQPSVLFTALKPGQKLALGQIPATADKVVDRNGQEINGSNAPSLNGIVASLKKSAPATDGTPGQKVQVENADGSVASSVAKISDPVSTAAVKTTIDLNVQAAAQQAVNQAPNSSMVVIQPSTGNILAVANNPPNGLDIAMVGRYAPGSTFKTITTTLVLNKGIINNLNQTWDCPKTLNADGITLHNSEQEGGGGESFLWDFAQSCNNAFSSFEGKVTRSELAGTAHDYYGLNQKWDVGLGQPTTYGTVPDTSSNSLAEELVGQDQITTSPLVMASVAATIANGSFKQPILAPGTAQLSLKPLPASTDQNLKTLMRAAVTNGTLTGVLTQPGVYGKTGTAEVQGKTANSWTIAVHGDFAVAALAVGGNFGAQTAGPECNALLKAVS